MQAQRPDHGPISNAMEVVHTAYCISNVHAPLSRLQPNAIVEAFLHEKTPEVSPHVEASNNRCFFWPASPHFVYLNLFMGGEDELSVAMEEERLGG
jgi:hypothetical protein